MLLINKTALFKPKEIQLETDSKTANIEKKMISLEILRLQFVYLPSQMKLLKIRIKKM